MIRCVIYRKTKRCSFKHGSTILAVALEDLYIIQKNSDRANDPATFGDILWNKSRNPHPKSRQTKPLFQIFSRQQWTILYELNESVNGHLHLEMEYVNGTKVLFFRWNLAI
jgi:hypothetical protein